MTVLLLERRLTEEERDLQDALKSVWRRLDVLDIETERKILGAIVDTRREILDRLLSIPQVDVYGELTWQATDLRRLNADLEDSAERLRQRIERELTDAMGQAATMSDEAHRAALDDLARNQGVPRRLMVPIGGADAQIAAAVLYNTAALKNMAAQVVTVANREVQRVVFGGGTRHDAVTAIRDALAADPKYAGKKLTGKQIGGLTQRAITIERTALISVFNVAAQHAISEAADELPGMLVEWVAVPDKRVDPECVKLNGKRRTVDGTFPGNVIAPPRHPRCRCRLVPYLPAWNDGPLTPASKLPAPGEKRGAKT